MGASFSNLMQEELAPMGRSYKNMRRYAALCGYNPCGRMTSKRAPPSSCERITCSSPR